MGALALVEALGLLEQDMLRPVPQHHERATYAPKLTRAAARIDWTKPADVVARAILGFDPRPGAWTELDGHEVKLFHANPAEGGGVPGEVVGAANSLVIATGSSAVDVAEVQPAGKPRMTAAEWIRGRGARVGQRFA